MGMLVAAVGMVFAVAGTANALTVTSSSDTVAPGETATIVYSIADTGGNVATYNAEVSFDATNLTFVGCEIDARLTDQIGQFTNPSEGTIILFVGDTSPPVGTFDDGTMATCTFTAAGDAAEADYPLTTTFLEVGDAEANVLEADAMDGQVTVMIPPPTATPTETPIPTITPTRTNTVPPTDTPTPGGGDDDGCQIGAKGGSGSGWMLFLPAAVLFFVRRRRR